MNLLTVHRTSAHDLSAILCDISDEYISEHVMDRTDGVQIGMAL